MSLVIMARDKSVGIAVCDGRARGYVAGKRVITDEDYSKLARLTNGGILGFVGRVRDGYPLTNSLSGVIEDHLLPDITLAAREMKFSGLCRFIPELLKEYAAWWPGLLLFVSLLGRDNGVIRGDAWDSDGGTGEPTGLGTSWHILGTKKLCAEADAAVHTCLRGIGGLRNPSMAGDALKSIIRLLAMSDDDINDHTRVEYLYIGDGDGAGAGAEARAVAFAALTADMIKTGTLDASAVDITNINASNISTGTLSASKVLFPDGSDMTTAARVDTAKVTLAWSYGNPPSWSSDDTTNIQAVTGLGVTTSAESTLDVYNFQGILNNGPNSGQYKYFVCVDGSTSVDYSSQLNGYFFGSISGLTPGTHTIQVYIQPSAANSPAFLANCLFVCQRIY